MIEASKSEMPCNKPKAEPHGHGETGKSHVVKACSDGKEKLIRFGCGRVRGYGASVEVDVSAGRPSFRHVSLEAIEGGANNRRDIA